VLAEEDAVAESSDDALMLEDDPTVAEYRSMPVALCRVFEAV